MSNIIVKAASKKEIKAARRAVMDIIETPAADAVKVAALESMHYLVSVHGTAITGNQFYTEPKQGD